MEKFSNIAIEEALSLLPDDRQKAEYLFSVHEALHDADPQRALRYSKIALEFAERSHNSGITAQAEYNHGDALLTASDASKAGFYFGQALTHYRTTDDKTRIARALNKIGAIYAKTARYDQAIEYFLEAMQVSRRLENKLSYAHSLNNLGTCYRIQGNFAQAMNFIRQAVNICKDLRDKGEYSDMLCSIGIVCYQMGDHDAALEHYFQSQRLMSTSDVRRLSRVFNNIGNVYFALELYEKALDFHTRALTVRKKIGNRNLIGDSLNNCGNCYLKLGKMKLAIDHLTRAFEMKRRTGDARGEAYALSNLAKFYMDEGDFLKARQLFEEAIEAVHSKPGELEIRTHAHLELGIIAIREGDGSEAEKHLTTALKLTDELKQPDVQRDIFKNLAELFSKITSHKDRKKALEFFKKYTALQEGTIGENKKDAVSRLEIQFKTKSPGL
jgi:tetratricopeptide (TPR) repeat protein